MRIESAEFLKRLYEAIWRAVGASAEEAAVMAEALLAADLMGKETQGAVAFTLIHPRVMAGGVTFGEPPTTIAEGPGHAVLDGHLGPGQVVATRAMELAVEKARAGAVGCVWVRNTNVFTAAAHHAMQAVRHDCFGMLAANGVPLVAPWGGRDPVFNTSPMGFAVPAGAELPIVYDGATSTLSHGKVVLAAREGRRLPGGVLVDDDGRVTDDPAPLIADPFDRNSEQLGAILPFGPKGFAWLVLVETLTGLMAGASRSREIPRVQTAEHPWSGGLFFMAVDVGKLTDFDRFKGEVDALIRDCKAARRADGFAEIVMPGERAQRTALRRRVEGIPLRDEDWRSLERIAADSGVDIAALREG